MPSVEVSEKELPAVERWLALRRATPVKRVELLNAELAAKIALLPQARQDAIAAEAARVAKLTPEEREAEIAQAEADRAQAILDRASSRLTAATAALRAAAAPAEKIGG